MATSTSWAEVLTLLEDMDARAADALIMDQLRWDLLDASTHQANTHLITSSALPAHNPTPDVPVVPPDAPSAPEVEREPNIDPPPTAPPADAPGEDPRQPPAPPRTTRVPVKRGQRGA